MKISVIGGGNMGGSIAQGAVKDSIVKAQNVTISDPSPAVNKFFSELNPLINLCQDNTKAIIESDMIIIAVKPWLVESVLGEISDVIDRKNQMVVSIAAGISFDQLNQHLKSEQKGSVALYRVIPNTAISIGNSATFISKHNSSIEQDNMVISLMNSLGKAFVVEESQMASMTSLASCGIAYIYKYIDASIKGGVEMGIDVDLAREVVLHTVQGALDMLNTNKTMPQTEINKVTTPGGITLKGLEEMEHSGFTTAVINGLMASNLE